MCHQCNKSENVRFVIGDTIDNQLKVPVTPSSNNSRAFCGCLYVFVLNFKWQNRSSGMASILYQRNRGEGREDRGEWLIYQIMVCIGCTWKGQNGNKQELWFCDQHQLHNQLTFSYCWKVIYISMSIPCRFWNPVAVDVYSKDLENIFFSFLFFSYLIWKIKYYT